MDMQAEDSRFVEEGKPYTNLRGGWMSKGGMRPVYILLGAAVLLIAMSGVFFLSKIGHENGAGSALKTVSRIENRIETLGARVDKLQAVIETVSGQVNAVGGNTKAISALSKNIRTLQVELKRLASIKAKQPKGKKTVKRAKTSTVSHVRYHVVKKGETLYRIAKNYRISLVHLMSENHLTTKSVIHPGDRLAVGR